MVTPIQEFYDLYEEYDDLLVDEFDNLVDAETFADKAVRYNILLAALALLLLKTGEWLDKYLQELYLAGATREANRLGLDVPGAVSQTALEGLGSFRLKVTTYLTNISNSVNQEAVKLYATPLLLAYPQLAEQARRELPDVASVSDKVKEMVRKLHEEGLVQVTASNGKTYSFSLADYAKMVIDAVRTQLEVQGAIDVATETGNDLVRISNNPSMHGDWCELYRGRVYSISGNHPVFPPLASLPNGGAPFHPHCRHVIEIFRPGDFTASEISDMRTEEQWLLRQGETNPNRIIRAYWRGKRKR